MGNETSKSRRNTSSPLAPSPGASGIGGGANINRNKTYPTPTSIDIQGAAPNRTTNGLIQSRPKRTGCFNISFRDRRSSSRRRNTKTRFRNSEELLEFAYEYRRNSNSIQNKETNSDQIQRTNDKNLQEDSGGSSDDVVAVPDSHLIITETMEERRHINRGPSRPFRKGDRVVWLGGGRPELGIFKWHGVVDGVLCAGLELSNKRCVSFHNQTGSKKFSCQSGHRALVPMEEVKLYFDYVDLPASTEPPSSSASGVRVIQGPIKIESKADKYERQNIPPQDKSWEVGDIILFRDTMEKAEIIKTYLRKQDLVVTIKFTPESTYPGRTEDKLLLDIMSVADVIRTTYKKNSNAELEPLKNLPGLSPFNVKERSLGTNERSPNVLFPYPKKDSPIPSYSSQDPESSSSSHGSPPQNVPSPPPQRSPRPKMEVLSFDQNETSPKPELQLQPEVAQKEICPTQQPLLQPEVSASVRSVLQNISGVGSRSGMHPILVKQVTPELLSKFDQSPRKSEGFLNQVNMKPKPNDGRAHLSLSEPYLPVTSSHIEHDIGAGVDEVDKINILYSSKRFNRENELEYYKGWSKTYRKSQRQAAHKGIEAILKRQIKAASLTASGRESNISDFKKSALTEDMKYLNSEDLSKELPSDFQSIRRPSQIEYLDSPKLVRVAETNLRGLDSVQLSSGLYSPFTSDEIQLGIAAGTQKGIQGQLNSCYLDATLFSLFYCSAVFDDLVLASRSTDSDLATQVKSALRDLVNILRSKGICLGNEVMKFRDAMEPVCDKIKGSFMDAEEFMFKLFDDALNLPEFIHYSTDVSDYLTQLLIDTRDNKKCRTVQDLLETSLRIQEYLKFKSTPRPALIIEMPRSNGVLVQYSAIIPNMTLRIGHLIEGLKPCVCDGTAVWDCESCVRDKGESVIAYCDTCRDTIADTIHQGLNHAPELVERKANVLDLLAVICIRGQHYVTFVKTGQGPSASWLFFDSMTGPEVEVVPEMNKWLMRLEQNPEIYKDKNMPPRVKRLITDNHICIYYSP